MEKKIVDYFTLCPMTYEKLHWKGKVQLFTIFFGNDRQTYRQINILFFVLELRILWSC